MTDTPLLDVRGLSKRFHLPFPLAARLRGERPRVLRALHDVSFSVGRGETLGIVGESGCGKSTLARCLVRLYEADAGRIDYDGMDIRSLAGPDLRRYNRRVQMVFQDPYSSLDPRMTVAQTLGEALRVHRLRRGAGVAERIRELLDLVRMPADAGDRYPREFSGGQRQRIGIARALAVEPDCLVADELVSALDVSIQAQIVNLLLELQQRLKLTILFIAHDLRLVRHLSHRVAVMYLGEIVEIGPTEAIFGDPRHPYTRGLLAAEPRLRPGARSTVEAVRGELPSPLAVPSGCPFHPRCPSAFARCPAEQPALRPVADSGHAAACFLVEAPAAAAIARSVA